MAPNIIPMTTPTTAFGLIERVKQGDRDAFTPLFEKYQRRLAVLIYYKLGEKKRRPEDVDEILQETFLAAYEDIDQFHYRLPGSFLNWLSRIADHVIVDEVRFQNRLKRNGGEVTRFRSETNPHGPDPVDSQTPSRFFAERQEVDALFEKLNALPPQYREVILLAKIEGLSTQEMSERLGKSRGEVALLLHRAIRKFREMSGPHD
jgi:RNA polymerase sigma-70 factor (ECF subfamily)